MVREFRLNKRREVGHDTICLISFCLVLVIRISHSCMWNLLIYS